MSGLRSVPGACVSCGSTRIADRAGITHDFKANAGQRSPPGLGLLLQFLIFQLFNIKVITVKEPQPAAFIHVAGYGIRAQMPAMQMHPGKATGKKI